MTEHTLWTSGVLTTFPSPCNHLPAQFPDSLTSSPKAIYNSEKYCHLKPSSLSHGFLFLILDISFIISVFFGFFFCYVLFSLVQSLSHVWLFATPKLVLKRSMLSSRHILRFMTIKVQLVNITVIFFSLWSPTTQRCKFLSKGMS